MRSKGTAGAKAPPKPNIAAQRAIDEGSVFALEVGITTSQAARKLGKKPEDVRARIIAAGLKSKGKRVTFDCYDVFEVAALFVEPPPEFFENFMREASHHDLPKTLTKEFWAGLSMRAKYEREAGDLWHTNEILQGIAGMQKIVRMMLLTLPDHMHRQKPLTSVERKLVKDLCDNTLRSMESAIHEAFGKPVPALEGDGDQVAVPGKDAVAGRSVKNEASAVAAPSGAYDAAWDL